MTKAQSKTNKQSKPDPRNLLYVRAKHAAKPGVSKATGYQCGIYTIPYDLKGIVEVLGAARTIELVTVLANEVRKERHNTTSIAKSHSQNKLTQRVIASKAETTLQRQITATVARSLQQLRASQQANNNRAKKAA